MELLDRYLQSVGKHLPWNRQEDIIAELRANLEAQLEDKEAELGRPLTTSEAEAWLKPIGSPAQMAARYQPQRYVIGPTLYPTFIYVLRITWFWATAVSLVTGAVQIADHPSAQAAAERLVQLPFTLLVASAWVTLIFGVIERVASRWSLKLGPFTPPSAAWSPSTLPALEKDEFRKEVQSRARAITEVIFRFLGLIWLLLLPNYPYLLLGPGAYYLDKLPYQLAPVWVPFYWWAVALNGLQLAWRGFELARGNWQRPLRWLRLAEEALNFIPVLILLTAPGHLLLVLRHPATAEAAVRTSVEPINHTIYLCLVLICALFVVTLGWKLGQFILEIYRKRAAGLPSSIR
jgi:hypothetical protein